MEKLASLFVSVVVAVNGLVPQADIPQVLGVNVENAEKLAHEDTTDYAVDSLQDKITVDKVSKLDALQEAREARAATLDEARAKRADARRDAQSRRDEFKERLERIKDERKKRLVEKINNKLATKNERWTTHFDKALTRLTEILAKIESRAKKAEKNGHDITVVKEAIANATAAIDTAQGVVNTQSEKVYIVEITDEDSLREAVKAAIARLRTDLHATREYVKEARAAVHSALAALKSIRGVDKIK